MYLGIDFGTSGCRASVIDDGASLVAVASIALPSPRRSGRRVSQPASIWLDGLYQLLEDLARHIDPALIRRIAVDGTSGSVLLTDADGNPVSDALMYNDASGEQALEAVRRACPDPHHLCLNLGSGLVKAVQLAAGVAGQRYRIVNQADWITSQLCADWGHSDYHNALKLGYDVVADAWPDWVEDLFAAGALPRVHEPGAVIGRISPAFARRCGLSTDVEICAGSTDANAAFIAAGARQPGQAVTSLGSTLVLKLLCRQPVNELQSGVYSHRLGDFWLAGGASNAGAAILRDFFSDEQIVRLSDQIDPATGSGLNYYPLRTAGERFPIYDPDKAPQLTPRPASDVIFLQGLLEGLATIERDGYRKLVSLGAPELTEIYSAGGGAQNPQWQTIRQRLLRVPVSPARHTQAATGAALLAGHGLAVFKQ